ncbi:MAG: hypothetical protein KDC12_09520 [Flavobacteriales bacterium]|nr:hypothetical protein [Flavobacteriales bacterium]
MRGLACAVLSFFAAILLVNGQDVRLNVFTSPAQTEAYSISESEGVLDPNQIVDNQLFNYTAYVHVVDTVDISSIEVVLTQDSTVLANLTFAYDSAPPSGGTYERIENNIFLGLGVFAPYEDYLLEVVIEDLSGSQESYSFDPTE